MFERKFDIIDFGVKFGVIKATYNTLKATYEDDFPPKKEKKENKTADDGGKEISDETSNKTTVEAKWLI